MRQPFPHARVTQTQKGGLCAPGRGSTYWMVQLPCKPQVRGAWDNSHPHRHCSQMQGLLTPGPAPASLFPWSLWSLR